METTRTRPEQWAHDTSDVGLAVILRKIAAADLAGLTVAQAAVREAADRLDLETCDVSPDVAAQHGQPWQPAPTSAVKAWLRWLREADPEREPGVVAIDPDEDEGDAIAFDLAARAEADAERARDGGLV